jgi:colicin import membrane protein
MPKRPSNAPVVLSWLVAPIMLVVGAGAFTQKHDDWLGGIASLLLGLILLPPLNRFIRRITGGRLTRTWTGVASLCLATVWIASSTHNAAMEKARIDQLSANEAKALAERAARREALLREFPFVRPWSFDAWVLVAHDSATKPELTMAGFIAGEQTARAIALRQQRADSIARVKREKERRAAARKEAAYAAAAERRARASAASTSRAEYSGGHEIHIGPRGGRYYINANGNKTYIH